MFLRIEDYMLPCLNKKLFGLNCMGCGLQRSLAFILQGKFIEALNIYPAIYTLIIFIGYIIINSIFKFKNSQKIILTLTIINIILIVSNFIFKNI